MSAREFFEQLPSKVDPAKTGQVRGKSKHSPDVGEPPPVDRLVVVTHEADVPSVARQQEREVQLGPVEVLRLVHQQRRAAPTPAPQRARVGLEQYQGADEEVVEVQSARCGHGALVGDERPGDRSWRRIGGDPVGGDPQVELEP